MIVLLIFFASIEILFLIFYTPHAFLWWPLPVAVLYGYFYLNDNAEHTGEKYKKWVRDWMDWTDIEYTDKENHASTVYFVYGNNTNICLVNGLGVDAYYILPHWYFIVPIVREIALWTGGVSDKYKIETIMKIINDGKSICYSLNKTDVDKNNGIDCGLFSFLKEEKINIAPVVIYNESYRYEICRSRNPQMPWFFHFVLKQDPPPAIHIGFKALMCPAKYENRKEFNEAFNKAFLPSGEDAV